MLNKPRVCLLTETFRPVVGGGETQAGTLAEGLVEHGFRVTVVTRRSNRAFAKREQYGGVTVHRIPPVGSKHLLKWGLLITGIVTLLRLRHEYDLIFVSGFRVLGVPAVVAAKLCGKACILKADSIGELSGDFFSAGLAQLGLKSSGPLFRMILRLRNALFQQADAFVAISTAVAQELVAGGISPNRIHLIPNSVDEKRYHPVEQVVREALRRRLGLPVPANIIIYTGRLVTYKGLRLLLQAWRKIQAGCDRCQLVLVGAGGLDLHNCEEELKAFVIAHNLHTSVTFTGDVTNVHEYLQAADIFILPSENEAFGISLIEAMACGLAVVGTSVGGMKDILRDEKNGLVIEPRCFHQLVESLQTLIANPNLSRRLGATARRTVENTYSSERVNRQYMKLFERMAR